MKSSAPSLQERLVPSSKRFVLSNLITICPMKSIVCISSTAASISMVLPQVNVDGKPVPVFFSDQPSLYHIFIICTLFAFLGAFSSLMIQHKPRVERFCKIYAMAFILSALAIVLYAAALSAFT
nr:hypothetical protein CFP56_18765 [Quercus suber]POE91881.1 hypothetical protein CFP56_76842 [Quercus suber]